MKKKKVIRLRKNDPYMKELVHIPCGKHAIYSLPNLGFRCLYCGVAIQEGEYKQVPEYCKL